VELEPAPPPCVAGLPTDTRGHVVPAEAGWVGGLPVISKVDTDRNFVHGMNRSCAVCGFRIPGRSTGYRAFAQADAAWMRQHEQEGSHDLGRPLHLSCVLYSAIVCPYLGEKTSRLQKDSTINPGARRGTRAAIIGFADFGLLVPIGPTRDATVHFAYRQMVQDIGYRDGAELHERLREATATEPLSSTPLSVASSGQTPRRTAKT